MNIPINDIDDHLKAIQYYLKIAKHSLKLEDFKAAAKYLRVVKAECKDLIALIKPLQKIRK